MPGLLVDECDGRIELIFLEFGVERLTLDPEILAPEVRVCHMIKCRHIYTVGSHRTCCEILDFARD